MVVNLNWGSNLWTRLLWHYFLFGKGSSSECHEKVLRNNRNLPICILVVVGNKNNTLKYYVDHQRRQTLPTWEEDSLNRWAIKCPWDSFQTHYNMQTKQSHPTITIMPLLESRFLKWRRFLWFPPRPTVNTKEAEVTVQRKKTSISI